MKLRVLSLFSGIGAFEMALRNIEIDYELVNFCENDKYAIVENYSAQDLRDMGYTTEQITSRKNVSLYDEIILKPEQKEK